MLREARHQVAACPTPTRGTCACVLVARELKATLLVFTAGLDADTDTPGTISERLLILCRAQNASALEAHLTQEAETGLGPAGSGAAPDGDVGGMKATSGESARQQVAKAEKVAEARGEAEAAGGAQRTTEELQQMVSVLRKEKEEAQAALAQMQLQSKVDINWYESQLQALEHDSCQLAIATSRVRMLESESEVAKAQGEQELDAIKREVDAARALVRDEQQARFQQQKKLNEVETALREKSCTADGEAARLRREMEDMGEKHRTQISVLESTLKLYIDEQRLAVGETHRLSTPSPEPIHAQGLHAVTHPAPGQEESVGRFPLAFHASKDCGVQCSLDIPLEAQAESFVGMLQKESAKNLQVHARLESAQAEMEQLMSKLKQLEEQNSTLRQTVKDANGIIVKSEALTHDYRRKVLHLTRELTEAQAGLADQERDVITRSTRPPAVSRADEAPSPAIQWGEDSCHLTRSSSKSVLEPGGQPSTHLPTTSVTSTHAVLLDEKPSHHEPRAHLTHEPGGHPTTFTAQQQNLQHMSMCPGEEERALRENDADTKEWGEVGRKRDSSPLSWAAAAAASRLQIDKDPSSTLQFFVRRGPLGAKGGYSSGGGVERSMNGGRLGEVRRNVRFEDDPRTFPGMQEGKHVAVGEVKRVHLGERNGRGTIHRI